MYFLLACLLSWLVLFPAGRDLLISTLERAGIRWRRRVAEVARRQEQGAAELHRSGRAQLAGMAAYLRRHYALCAAGLALVCVPPMVALLAGSRPALKGFEASTREINPQVAGLLEGEQLVPPPALPPLAFTTAEVELARPMIATASRDWALLDQAYAQRLLLAFRIMKEQHGYDMAILEGYRSPERQNRLAALGTSVTSAAAFQSWHQYGLAADSAFVRDGKLVISEQDPWAMRGYQLYGEVAESLGMTWGGRWKMRDFGHTELRVPGVMKR
ncbi:M15 family metallopeptidase [Pseudoduganella sp. LjRoot289]|uniref:M15 family metallopeptidase n=1 Tax=Pseudoduganella sp. LjRoot289 TaxID=3342314 RepID=UPI003ED12898